MENHLIVKEPFLYRKYSIITYNCAKSLFSHGGLCHAFLCQGALHNVGIR